jgi:hypothetical protein
MRLALLKGQTVEKPLELAAADAQSLGFTNAWPFESAFLQPTVVEPEPIAIPVQDFEPVTALITEHKHAIREWIKLKLATDYSSQAVDGFTHIG